MLLSPIHAYYNDTLTLLSVKFDNILNKMYCRCDQVVRVQVIEFIRRGQHAVRRKKEAHEPAVVRREVRERERVWAARWRNEAIKSCTGHTHWAGSIQLSPLSRPSTCEILYRNTLNKCKLIRLFYILIIYS
jgi:hypothetical protein